MANIAQRLSQNVPGEFFVDSTCIDCDACRQIEPSVYAELDEGYSFVHHQPKNDKETQRALMALVTCPTGSIGTTTKLDIKAGVNALPELIEDNVYFCGFNSESSFGASSYVIQRPEGNVLVDSPRSARPLLKKLESMGGIKLMFLTHRDDVADHEDFHKHFGCDRILHRDDIGRSTQSIEIQPEGIEPVRIAGDLTVIPVPGHTRGHAVLLYRDKFLFTGDHLAWSTERNHLYAFRRHCWYSWEEQIKSMERLLGYNFEWVLPGHGRRYRAESTAAMHGEMEQCVAWMKRQ
ncbi:MAG TPA: MBL fold metallo-hydrolase [Blastocatellia bacterium]|nr:MBL fold metallo-hydrolase [Blastocatellia bacterium]